MKIKRLISAYRWPIFLGGILAMSVVAQGVLVYVATRPDSPRPIADYYERGLQWEADVALLVASRRLGWSVNLEIPSGEQFAMVARRPVDITVVDRDGQPVTGLVGRLVAVRPADTRLSSESPLTALPQAPGRYRTLAHLPTGGVWELSLDVSLADSRFLFTKRVIVDGEETP